MRHYSVFAAAWQAGELTASLDPPADDDSPGTWVENLADAAPAHDGPALARRSLSRLVREAGLSDRERVVLVLRFGIRAELTVEQIASAIGCTHQAISHAERRALAKLRETAAAGQ